MATVQSKTSTKVDDLLDDTLASARIENDSLYVTTKGGADVLVGVIGTPMESAPPASAVLYVDPVSGNDSNSGRYWASAFATLSAAVAAAPTGGKIVLAATDHDVGAGFSVSASKKLTIAGVHPLSTRQHSGSAGGQARLYSSRTGASRPSSYIQITAVSGTNHYGWTFESFYVDGNTLLPGGAAIDAHGVNRAIVRDVAGRCQDEGGLTLVDGGDARYLVKSDNVGVGTGADASWWRMEDCFTMGMRMVLATSSNYWVMSNCSANGVQGSTGPKPAGPSINLNGSAVALIGCDLEGWEKGAVLSGRNPIVTGCGGESMTTAIHLLNAYDAHVEWRSNAGYGGQGVIDENGTNNIIIGNMTVTRVGTTTRSHSIMSNRGTVPEQPAGDWLTPIYGKHSSAQNPAYEVWPSHFGNTDLGLSGITAEYWDGAAWQAWLTPAQCNALHQSNQLDAITIDATHARCRFRCTIGNGAAATLVMGILSQTVGTSSTMAVRVIAVDGTTVVYEKSCGFGDATFSPAWVRGFLASLSQQTGGYMEVELTMGLTGGQTASLKRLHFFHPGDTSGALTQVGRYTHGRINPEGVVTGKAGDFHFTVGTSSGDNTDVGLWRKVDGTGNTGWAKATFYKRYLVKSVALDFGNIPANDTAEMTTTLTGAVVGDLVTVTPATAPTSGIMFSGYVSAADTITVRGANVTLSPINPTSITFSIESKALPSF